MLGIADYGAFCATILLFLALPGPGTLALLTSTSHGGLRGGAAATLGLILGDQVLLWLAVAGLAALLAAQPGLLRLIQYFGSAYLAWVGLRLLFADARAAPPVPIHTHQFLRQAFFITLLNPKAIVFYMAFFPLFIHADTHRGSVTFVAMAATIAAITAGYCLLLCAAADAIASTARAHRRLARWLQRAAGAVLLGFGIRLATQ